MRRFEDVLFVLAVIMVLLFIQYPGTNPGVIGEWPGE